MFSVQQTMSLLILKPLNVCTLKKVFFVLFLSFFNFFLSFFNYFFRDDL